MLTALLFYRLARLDVPSKGVVNDWDMALFSMLICDARSRADKHSDVASWQKLGRSLHASMARFLVRSVGTFWQPEFKWPCFDDLKWLFESQIHMDPLNQWKGGSWDSMPCGLSKPRYESHRCCPFGQATWDGSGKKDFLRFAGREG